MKKRFRSFSKKLALRFTFVLALAVIVISIFMLIFLNSLVKSSWTQSLKESEEAVFQFLQTEDSGTLNSKLSAPNLPYYHTYLIYEKDTINVISTNDPFLPILSPTVTKARHLVIKDFFFDGDLDILYFAKEHSVDGKTYVTATVQNMDNNLSLLFSSKLHLAVIALIVPVLILSYIVSYLIVKNTISPVVKITKQAQAMTTQNLDHLLPVHDKNDEIEELSKTFNDLFCRIKADFDRERQFSSDVSHELNTPLTVISGQANLLLRWGKDNPVQLEKSLRSIKNEASSMHAIIENLLQISRIESGRIKPQKTEVFLKDIFERITDEFLSLAPDGTLRYDDQNIRILSDSEMLHQILLVFVSNSVKFASPGCNVTLLAKRSKNTTQIIFSDNGPGIQEQDLPHIFERFYRSDEAHSRSQKGSGLGLAIAKTLCDALNAELTAGNQESGGASFTLTFHNS